MSRWWWLVALVVAALFRELIIWLGYSWIVGTAVGVVVLLGFLVLMDRRLRHR
jgi:hypothetical protein